MKINFGIASLFLSLIFTVEIHGQTKDIDTPDLTRDMKTVTLIRIANPQVERLPKACTAKRGRWIFEREARVDCYALQVDGFVKDEKDENRIEYPLSISIFDTIEEAKSFARNMSEQIIKDKDSLTIFKSPSVTFLSFPVSKNQILPTVDPQKVFIVSRIEIPIDIFNLFSVPVGDIGDFISLKDIRDFDFTKTTTEDLKKILEAKDIKPVTLVYTRSFIIFTQVTSKILDYRSK